MDRENSPTLPDAHQQIRLGDLQASAQKWIAANAYYSRAIEYFEEVKKSLQDQSLIPMIQAQIIQCEKTVHFCSLKNQADQAMKAERQSKIARTQSVSSLKPTTKSHRMMTRHNTLRLENNDSNGARTGMDSFAAFLFLNDHRNKNEKPKINPPSVMKKQTKDDSQKMEELQTSNEAYKTHLAAAMEYIQRLEREKKELISRTDTNTSQQQINFGLSSTNENDDENESENELEATI